MKTGLIGLCASKSNPILGMLTAMDFAIGRLVEYLKASNLYENTVIVFTSDVSIKNRKIPCGELMTFRMVEQRILEHPMLLFVVRKIQSGKVVQKRQRLCTHQCTLKKVEQGICKFGNHLNIKM